METVSLHPIEEDIVREFVASASSDLLGRAAAGSVRAANQLTFGLAAQLAQSRASFAARPFGFTFWEAQVDRSLGMLLRPPARLFQDAGMDRRAAHAMPIRLEPQAGTMGGAWLPARLVPKALDLLDAHLERSAKRLVEAELDPMLALELLHTALTYARDEGVGLMEVQDLIVMGAPAPAMPVYWPDPARLPDDFHARVVQAMTPPKKPGLLDRLRRRPNAVSNGQSPNGHYSDVTAVERHEQ